MVDLTRDQDGRVRARLLDLVPGRSGKGYADWLDERGEEFKTGIKVATLDPFHGYKNAIDDQLQDAVAVLDAFHVVKLGSTAVDECRRRVQQETLDHRGRSGDPLYGIRNLLRAGAENLTERQWARFQTALAVNEEHHLQVYLAWHCAQQLRDAYRHHHLAEDRKIAGQLLESMPSCPIPEIAPLGRTSKQWRQAFLAYFDTRRSSNGDTEAVNGLIELHRRVARGFRNRNKLPTPDAPDRRRPHQPPPEVRRARYPARAAGPARAVAILGVLGRRGPGLDARLGKGVVAARSIRHQHQGFGRIGW